LNDGDRHSVAEVLELIDDPDEKARQEAENGVRQFNLALAIIRDHVQDAERPFRLRSRYLVQLNGEALKGIHPLAGTFRNGPVKIGGSRHTPPEAFMVPEEVEALCDYVNDHWQEKDGFHLSAYILWPEVKVWSSLENLGLPDLSAFRILPSLVIVDPAEGGDELYPVAPPEVSALPDMWRFNRYVEQLGGDIMRLLKLIPVALLFAPLVLGGFVLAATSATKDEAVAMVKKAVATIKREGPDKAYAEIDDPKGPFVDRDLYITVVNMDGVVLAHGADKTRIGTNQLNDKDPDGKEFLKERIDLAKTEPSFWQSYKFMNPVTKQVEPKQMYCERLNDTVVCGGVY
jgi:cytochrome c